MAQRKRVLPVGPVHEVNAKGFQQERHEVLVTVTPEGNEILRQGLACMNCLAEFPAPPSPRTVEQFEPLGKWGENIVVIRERICAGSCPICGYQVTQENYSNLLWTPK